MIEDYFKLGYNNIKKRKLRSGLTILGILIAVATIFVLISLSLGLDAAIKEEFKQLGSDKFFIMPKGQAGASGSGGAVELTTKDVDIIKKVSGIKEATPIIATDGTKFRQIPGIAIHPEAKAVTHVLQLPLNVVLGH